MNTDQFTCLPATTLLRWLLSDFKNGHLFGIDQKAFFVPKPQDPFRMHRYGQILETPLGVSAGPHTQLAQNILSAWVCGARTLELKTVQVLDNLTVSKPCISMQDEGYNCEWSQELTLQASCTEYIKAFVLIFILRDLLGLPSETEPGSGPGFLFTMSVGYNYAGILSPSVQHFLDVMEDSAEAIAELKQTLTPLYPRLQELPVPTRLSNSLTVSTMHGCPPEEIEKIGRYFLTERRYHTTIKLNPTLLGPVRLRDILHTRLGYPIEVPDEAFAHDLKYPDALSLIRNLQDAAQKAGVTFGLKLTNTLETENATSDLPAHEHTVYMSGRALHPLSIHLAERLQQTFAGKLDISFSGGVDAFNCAEVLACNLKPATVCSDLLKPGGYGRLSQYLELLGQTMQRAQVSSLEGWVRSHNPAAPFPALANLTAYAARLLAPHSRYHKHAVQGCGVKTPRPLPRFDCASPPCVASCPIGQAIPRYLEACAQGEYKTAWKIIIASNPLPSLQGMVCNHDCQNTCIRQYYDNPLQIREIKRFISKQVNKSRSSLASAPAPACGKRVAVVGAGPAGLACAYVLALHGIQVTVYEADRILGGMAGKVIPTFRLDPQDLKNDIQAIRELGVIFFEQTPVDPPLFEQLKKTHDAVFLGLGAQRSLPLGIPGEESPGVLDQLTFLSAVRQGCPPDLGQRVLVIGGGNSAMDVARTARRVVKNGSVTLVYRRTRRELPASPEECAEALEENIQLLECLIPEQVLVRENRVCGLRVARVSMEYDSSGKRAYPVKTGISFDLPAESILVAIGQQSTNALLPTEHGKIHVDPTTLQTSLSGVFAGGDSIRGAATLVQALADGRRAAESILLYMGLPLRTGVLPPDTRSPDWSHFRLRQTRRIFGAPLPLRDPADRLDFELAMDTLSEQAARSEARRCLQCDQFCSICVSVCPNRANQAVPGIQIKIPRQDAIRSASGIRVTTNGVLALTQPWQIVNIGDLCNECGNCTTFCPSSGTPSKDKPRIWLSASAFASAPDGFHFAAPNVLLGRFHGTMARFTAEPELFIYEDALCSMVFDNQTFALRAITIEAEGQQAPLNQAREMALLYSLTSRISLFNPGQG